MKYFVYIVKCADNTLYTGITTDVNRRVNEHNTSTKGAKYTRVRQPVRLVYMEEHASRSSASKEEYKIKKLTHIRKKELIKESGVNII